jgi:KRAB domain-containing zinc finger protein
MNVIFVKRNLEHRMILASHKRTHSRDRPYECDICKMRFKRLDHLVVHKRTHTGDRPYGCDVCKKSFVRLTTLVSHKQIHTGDKPYE